MTTTLSPAEERGLIGLSLESQMRNAFFAIPPRSSKAGINLPQVTSLREVSR